MCICTIVHMIVSLVEIYKKIIKVLLVLASFTAFLSIMFKRDKEGENHGHWIAVD